MAAVQHDFNGDEVTNAARWEIPETAIPTSEQHSNAAPMPSGATKRLTKFVNLVERLPAPGCVYRLADYDFENTDAKILSETNAIVKVGRAPSAAETGDDVTAYATNPVVWSFIESYSEDRETLPCCFAGKGFTNPSDGAVPDGWLLCTDCGAGHRKSLVREVLL